MEKSCAALIVLSGSALYSDTLPMRQIPTGEKNRITGTILSRHGDLVTVREKKSGDLVLINLFEDTKSNGKRASGRYFVIFVWT